MSKAEKFIQEHTKNCSNLVHLDDLNGNVWEENTPWLTPDQVRKAVEIAKDEMVERACKWLQSHYRVIDGEVEDFIWSLKQAMKDE